MFQYMHCHHCLTPISLLEGTLEICPQWTVNMSKTSKSEDHVGMHIDLLHPSVLFIAVSPTDVSQQMEPQSQVTFISSVCLLM